MECKVKSLNAFFKFVYSNKENKTKLLSKSMKVLNLPVEW